MMDPIIEGDLRGMSRLLLQHALNERPLSPGDCLRFAASLQQCVDLACAMQPRATTVRAHQREVRA